MIHAATVAYRGQAIALPAAGGTGKTSTMAKLMRREGWTFMGDDWAFLSDDAQLLGYEKPMFIKPHHRPIYPHLFEGARKPLVPVRLSRGVGRVTTVVHPLRDPLPAAWPTSPGGGRPSTGWSPREQAFPGRQADHGGARSRRRSTSSGTRARGPGWSRRTPSGWSTACSATSTSRWPASPSRS